MPSMFALLGTVANAQQSDMPPPMEMTPEEMRQMQTPPSSETHAPDLSIERPAASEHITPRMMAGMETDMNDAAIAHRVWLENFEGVDGARNGAAWDAQGWVGADIDKLWIKSEGTILGGKTQDSKVEDLWAHAILPFWDTQLGLRHDFGRGPSREWAAFGVQGISEYWVDVEVTGYIGEEGRSAVRLKTEYDLYLTQRLILKPEIELNAYGRPDRARMIGAGLSDGRAEIRLRYEFSRRFAPYVGIVYDQKFAGSVALSRAAGELTVDHQTVAGIEFFF